MQGVGFGLGGGGIGAFVGADQDVAGAHLLDHLRGGLGGIAHVDQLHQLEAAGAADRGGDLAGRHVRHHLCERGGDLAQAAPAQVAALQRVRAVGVAHRGGREVHLAAVEQRLHALDLFLGDADLLRGGSLGQPHQDVGDVVLGTAGGLRLQRGVDLGLGHRDLAAGEAVAQVLDHQLLADRVPELVEVQAVGADLGGELLDRGAVLRGDRGDRLVHFLVTHAHPGVAGAGHLQLQQHQSLGDLPLEHGRRRQLLLAAGVLGPDVGHGAVELAAQDDVLVHDGGDAVDRLHLLGKRWPRQQCPGDEAGEQFLHHGIGSREGS